MSKKRRRHSPARTDPDGITAISRWSSEATPPDDAVDDGPRSQRDRSADALASLRDAHDSRDGEPVVALRLPPANGSNPSGVETEASAYDLLPDLWLKAHPNHKWTIDDIHPRAPIPTGSQPLAGGRAKRHHRMTDHQPSGSDL